MINSVIVEGIVVDKPVFTTIKDTYKYYKFVIRHESEYKDTKYHQFIPVSVWKEELFQTCACLEKGDHITVSGKTKCKEGFNSVSLQVTSIIYGSKPKDDLVEKSYKKAERKNYLWGDKHTDEEKLEAQNVLRGAKHEREELVDKAKKYIEENSITKDVKRIADDLPF